VRTHLSVCVYQSQKYLEAEVLIHSFVTGSRVNGPGMRAVIYFQGCTLRCRGCWNPNTHSFSSSDRSIVETADSIRLAHGIRPLDGVTFSGGEPLQQANALLGLMNALHARLPHLSFGMYSGYSERELSRGLYWCRSELAHDAKQQIWREIKSRLDFAILGRYVAEKPSSFPLRSSSNQKLALLSNRYREEDFAPQEVEIQIGAGGVVQVTGFPSLGSPA
jgi:anaerobic ribonucleoside-triphosphate reductase activating protein